jgi:hypothetical protein
LKRPGVISFVGYLLVLGAVFSGVAGIALIVFRDDASILAETGSTGDELLFAGIVMVIVAAIQVLVGLGILGGSRIARGLVAVVVVLNVMSAAWLMFAHHTGAFLYHGLITVGVGAFVLWALFNERADEYYEAA